jgi:RNA-directed DNA polymerase
MALFAVGVLQPATPSEVRGFLRTVFSEGGQGAPTSPVIANAILFEFDQATSEFCTANNLVYSRYADDISISGNSRSAVVAALDHIGNILRLNHELRLNDAKTRIASRGGQQRVTGVVVNEQAVPPRLLRRKIRSAFHKASMNPGEYIRRLPELGGYLGYLKMFPKLDGTQTLQRYQATLQQVREFRKTSDLSL